MNALLMGARGCGKTTLARQLSVLMRRTMVDLDERTLARFENPTVTEVWNAQGELAWREAEVGALAEALDHDGQIIALGGGTPMIPEGRLMIENARQKRQAVTIYIKCSVLTLIQRLRANPGDRPRLTGEDLAAEVATILLEREPTYEALADLIYETDNGTPEKAVADLSRWLRDAGM